ncbi:TSUP family transporter [Thorsellia anophelis]|nr:TSUP family transporter [Thorsellia anophelis]
MNFIFNSETLWLLLALFSIALIAGFIDSIAGGGGLITIPALLALSGLTPAEALATNKLQAVGGSFSASLYFVRKKTIDLWQCKFLILTTFIGAIIGASLVRFLSKEVLETLLPILIIVVGCYFLFSPKIGEKDQKPRLSYAFMGLITALIGFYDGFFGPATGSFFTLAFVTLIGFNLISATAHAKVMNFTSNFGSLLFFAFTGNIVWHIGLIMLLGQVIGATFGARMVISKGHKLIRPMLVIVSFSISVKLLYNNYAHFFLN